MKHSPIANYKWQAKLLWAAMAGAAVVIVCVSGYRIFSFPPAHFVVLAVAIFVSVLVCRYEPTIPRSRLSFSAKNVFAFWGVIWLGIPGGVLLAASASITRLAKIEQDKARGFFGVCVDIIATHLSAITFYLALGYFPNALGSLTAGDFGHIN